MAYDGSLKFDTSLDTSDFQQGAGRLGDIVKGMAVFKILEKGFNMITSSVDRAVARYDTLQRFPRVLEQMGFSAEESSAAAQKLADGISGIPVALDDVVGTAQLLTVLTGNLDLATDTALALNYALIASGASSSDAARGLDMYTKMLSSGKVDMQSWRTLQETMGYALQKTAESFGFAGRSAQSDLYNALRDGHITFDQFNAKIVELSDGVGGFRQMAEASSGGIGTAFGSMRTRIAAGVADIIAALNRGFAQTKFKSIENMINATSISIRKAFKEVAGVFEFVAKNADILVPVIGTLVVGFSALKVVSTVSAVIQTFTSTLNVAKAALAASQGLVLTNTATHVMMTAALASETTAQLVRTAAAKAGMTIDAAGNLIKANGVAATTAETMALLASSGAMTAKTVIVGLLTGGISIATAAQWLWNAAMMANPIGLIIAAIVILIAAIVGLIAWLSRGTDGVSAYNKEAKEMAKQQKETAKSIKESEDAFRTSAESMAANAQVSKNLVAELRNIASSSESAESKHARMESAVNSLNAAVEGLNISYDRETGKIMDLNSMQEISVNQLDALVAAKSELAQATAWQDRANELEREKIRLLEEQLLIQAKIDEINADESLNYDQKRKLIAKLQKTYNEYGTDIEEVERRITIANQASAEANATAAESVISDYERQAKAASDAYDAVNGARDEDGRNLQQLAKLYNMTTDQILAEMAEQGLSMAEWSEKKGELFTKEGQSLQGVANQWGTTADEIIAYMDEMGMTLDEYVAEMEASHTKEGLSLQQLAEKWGTTSDAILTEMDNMGISMQQWSDMQQSAWADYESAVKERTSGVINGFKEIPKEFDKTGAEMLEILINNKERYAEWEAAMEGITRQLGPTAAEEFAKLGPEATSAMQEILDSAELMDQYRDAFGVKLDEVTGMAIEDWGDPAFIGAPSDAIDTSAQMVTQNPALQTAVSDQMENARTAAETVDFTSVGQSIATDINSSLNSADFSSVTTNIANAIRNGSSAVTGAVTTMSTSVQTALRNMSTQGQNIVTQMMTQMNSTITTRASTIRSSVTTMANGVITSLNTMSTQAQNITMQMMTQMNSTIVSRSATIRSSVTSMANGVITELDSMATRGQTAASNMMTNINSAITSRAATIAGSATAAANGVVSGFESMVQGAINVTNNMMDGIWNTMNSRAASLYSLANSIASNIARTMSDALEVRSPSLVMVRIFKNVMMGIYKSMDDMSGMLYRAADDIADNIADRLTVSPDVFGNMYDNLQSMTFNNPFSTTVPQPALAGGGGGVTYVTSLKQDITSPKPLSPSEITREGQDFVKRARWKLP